MADEALTWFRCMRCGHVWEATDNPKQERVCPRCKSNSVRKLRKRPDES
jgi:predicted Zn-ribbon and HTH transcriptional regulator